MSTLWIIALRILATEVTNASGEECEVTIFPMSEFDVVRL